ncbi:MAG: phosphotransferase family protein [Acidobacteriota bacterium]
MLEEATVPVRAGEEIDLERLRRFLEAKLGLVGEPGVRQFPSGYSNLTYLVSVGDRELVLRRPPVGSKVKSAHDMGREFRVLSRLHPVYSRVPRPLASCDDLEVFGFPFYLMERVPGVILRARLPPGVDLAPTVAAGLARELIENLAVIHGLELEASGLGELGRPQGYAARQVKGWAERYAAARTEEVLDLEQAFARLCENVPPDRGAALVHNDYKHDNLVLDPVDLTQIRAVLDWEMATVGDPLLDLGTTLGYWVEAGDAEELRRFRFGPTDLPDQPSRADLSAMYAAKSGRDLSDLPFYYAFGLCKIAVIAQQIYQRYRQGLTKDPRFAHLPPVIAALGRQATKAQANGSL